MTTKTTNKQDHPQDQSDMAESEGAPNSSKTCQPSLSWTIAKYATISAAAATTAFYALPYTGSILHSTIGGMTSTCLPTSVNSRLSSFADCFPSLSTVRCAARATVGLGLGLAATAVSAGAAHYAGISVEEDMKRYRDM